MDIEAIAETSGVETPLQAYYADRKLMFRNIFFILFCNGAWSLCFTVLGPLMQLRLNSFGLGERGISTISAINSFAVSFLVMYFSWKSDHCVSKWGRRLPFLAISAPFIVLVLVLFPLTNILWIMVGLMLVQMFFMDMMNSTFPLLNIDCMPQSFFARASSFTTILLAVTSFFALRYGMKLAERHELAPYYIGAIILSLSATITFIGVREPPIKNPATESFKPWSALKIGWSDRRNIILMLGVSTLAGTQMMWSMWLWLYAKNILDLSRADSGAAISWGSIVALLAAYPVGWIIDRFGSYCIIVAYWFLQMATLATILFCKSQNGLLAVTLLASSAGTLYGAADIIVYKSASRKEMGSFISSNAFLRNMTSAGLLVLSGQLIHLTGGSYNAAFILGGISCTCGMVLIFLHRWLKRKDPAKGGAKT